ncbi:MAG: dioxygenase [Planctomycetes bacterium]|nr:dioxygenase [Planctomycetota bacterium]MCC7398553.1 dioxygenase [Planctomycetota bacterium]
MTTPLTGSPATTPAMMPVVFVSHGAPTLALDQRGGADFARLAAAMPKPRAVLVVSAHWLDAPPTIGTPVSRPLLYDFAGFPDALYRVRYAAPPATALADELAQRLPALLRDDTRRWDHGVWVPLVHMYSGHDVPVLQVSMPWRWTPAQMFAFGQELAPLRKDRVLVLASGGAVHNLRQLAWNGQGTPPSWATDFEHWLSERVAARDFDALVDFRQRAPALQLAHPSDDHFVPLLVAAGAAHEAGAE